MEDMETPQQDEFENYEGEEEFYGVEKSTYLWFFLYILIFGYNSYAITHNICINNGYLMIALGLAVNIWILISFAEIFESICPKLNKNVSYILLIIALFIGLYLGYFPKNQYLEEASVDIVNSIIEKNTKTKSLVCKSVKIRKEASPGIYIATADLNNGKSIEIKIENKDSLISVELDKRQIKDK